MNKLKNLITLALVFLLPLFFLPLTQEYFIINKIYLLSFGVLLLLLVSAIQLIAGRRISWRRSPFDTGLTFVLISEIISIIVVTPNKIEALLNSYFGLAMTLALLIFYFALSQSASKKSAETHLMLLQWSGFIVAVVTIIFFFNPFKNIAFPTQFQFLKFSSFSPIGNPLDLAIFLGFLLVLQLSSVLTKKRAGSPFMFVFLIVFTFSLINSIYGVIKPESLGQSILFTPLRQSWFAAVEILKNPFSAIFGVGIGNFASLFALVKDVSYNQSSLWQIGSFNISRSALLHVITETGLLGLAAFGILFYSVLNALGKISKDDPERTMLFFAAGYVILAFIFLPPSFITFFLLVFTLYLVFATNHLQYEGSKQELDLTNLMPVYFGIGLFLIAFVIGAGYFLGRSYLAEYSFKKSVEGYLKNNIVEVYNNQRTATILNPYIERFHTNFSQTNLLIANNIATNAGKKLNDQQKQTIVQAIQAAINESKIAVTLNPQKATNWENLATVYRNILNAVQAADAWTISSYQRAIQLDPVNPIYRLNLGGVYYSLQKYNDAANLFAQAVSLKADWPNAHYNLAWASYQTKNYQQAASEMQNVLKLLDKKQNPKDYAKAQKELEQFKSQIPQESQATPEAKPGNLQLPSAPQQPQISPKLQLPKEASPEAK